MYINYYAYMYMYMHVHVPACSCRLILTHSQDNAVAQGLNPTELAWPSIEPVGSVPGRHIEARQLGSQECVGEEALHSNQSNPTWP